MGPWIFGPIPLILVSSLGLIVNAYVMLVVFSFNKQSQQQQSANTLLLIHLGAVETAVCLVLLIFSTGTWPLAGTWCALSGFLLALLHPIALWTITGLNCERYYAIAAPLHYSALVSPRRVVLGLSISWIGSILLCLTPFSGLVPPYRYVPGLGCCAPDFGNGSWGSAGVLYGAIYAFLGICLPALLVTLCNFRVLGIARYHRHRIASAIYEVTLSAQVTITHQRNPFFVPAATAPAANGPPRFHSAASTVMQLLGSLYLLYLPYTCLLLWEACGSGIDNISNLASSGSVTSSGIAGLASVGWSSILGSSIQHHQQIHRSPRIATSIASILLACSPPINGLLYGIKSRTLRRTVQNYWRKKATKSELQQEIQARTPSAAGSRRPSGSGPASTSFFPFPPLQRRLSEALLALGNCRAAVGGFGSGNIVGAFHRARLQPAASCNTLRVPNAELGETGRLVRSSASTVSLMAVHYRSDYGGGNATTMTDTPTPTANISLNFGAIASPKKSPRILITRAYSEESQEGASPLLRRHFATPVSVPPCEKRRWRYRSTESESSTGSSDASVWTTGLQQQQAAKRSTNPKSSTDWPCGPRRISRVKTLEEGAAVFSTVSAIGATLPPRPGDSTSADTAHGNDQLEEHPNNDDETNDYNGSVKENEDPKEKKGEEEKEVGDLESNCNEGNGNDIGPENNDAGEANARSDSSNSWNSSGAEDNSRGSDDAGLFMHPITETMIGITAMNNNLLPVQVD
ncbi:uncharacterized protein LOC106639294 [Copidosoma floridanum]|uniref:uncharacterized protein LOC106639294 n=1 Tax=Copidosoma floridanum TaxID=29053 RepID=UPI000C6F729B|nr:uncharacterized protein LOC106639294 [Copidosoma floridanum]